MDQAAVGDVYAQVAKVGGGFPALGSLAAKNKEIAALPPYGYRKMQGILLEGSCMGRHIHQFRLPLFGIALQYETGHPALVDDLFGERMEGVGGQARQFLLFHAGEENRIRCRQPEASFPGNQADGRGVFTGVETEPLISGGDRFAPAQQEIIPATVPVNHEQGGHGLPRGILHDRFRSRGYKFQISDFQCLTTNFPAHGKPV